MYSGSMSNLLLLVHVCAYMVGCGGSGGGGGGDGGGGGGGGKAPRVLLPTLYSIY